MKTRKSSCLNARGIPSATYQVLYMLSYPGGGGLPIPGWGGVSYPGYPPAVWTCLEYPHLDLAGLPHPPVWTWLGYPPACGHTNKLKLLPSLILRRRAVTSSGYVCCQPRWLAGLTQGWTLNTLKLWNIHHVFQVPSNLTSILLTFIKSFPNLSRKLRNQKGNKIRE